MAKFDTPDKSEVKESSTGLGLEVFHRSYIIKDKKITFFIALGIMLFILAVSFIFRLPSVVFIRVVILLFMAGLIASHFKEKLPAKLNKVITFIIYNAAVFFIIMFVFSAYDGSFDILRIVVIFLFIKGVELVLSIMNKRKNRE